MKQTIANLTKAFIGECQARNRYTFFASAAKKEGFEQISEIFTLTANQEKEHASWFYKLALELKKKYGIKDDVIVETNAPIVLGKTAENLAAAVAGEHFEWAKLYPEFAKVAGAEGFKDIEKRIKAIMVAEKHHEQRYTKILKEVSGKSVFKKKQNVVWTCRECGYVHNGKNPPDKCPSCGHEENFYQVECEKF